jgi:hypothetical protein
VCGSKLTFRIWLCDRLTRHLPFALTKGVKQSGRGFNKNGSHIDIHNLHQTPPSSLTTCLASRVAFHAGPDDLLSSSSSALFSRAEDVKDDVKSAKAIKCTSRLALPLPSLSPVSSLPSFASS